jgi:DNA-binding XRE family transcriptional regulator
MLRIRNILERMGNELYNRIAVLRAERSLSRQELADAVGINVQTVGFLERGDYSPSLTLALDLSAYFGLPMEAIFSRKPLKPLSEAVYGLSARGNDARDTEKPASLKRSAR